MTGSEKTSPQAAGRMISFQPPRPLSRTQLALFAGGSGDHNPIHIDSDSAKEAGFDDVIVPGMLLMAQLGRMLTDRAGPSSIRRWNARFIAVTPVCARPEYFARVLDEVEVEGEACLRVAVWAEVPAIGEVLRGEAVVTAWA